MGPLFCAEKYLLCWTLSNAVCKSGVMYRCKVLEIGGCFVMLKGFFGRDPEPVFKNPSLFPGVLVGARCLLVRDPVLLAVTCSASFWPC